MKKNSVLLIVGRSTSKLGDAIFDYINTILISSLGSKASVIMAIYRSSDTIANVIFNMIGGVYSDNHNRKKILIITDFLASLACFILAVIFNSNKDIYLIIIVNIFLAVLIVISGQLQNLTFIGVMVANTILGIIQEFKVKKTIDKLSVVTVEKVKTLRDGQLIDVPVEELVMDDIIFLTAGNQIGTDCQVVENHALEINESLLTGESVPVKKKENDEIYAGTFVVAGSGYAKVIRVGNANYSTKLVNQAKHKNLASSEMRDSIEKIIKVMSIIIVPVGILLFRAQYKAMPNDFNTALVKTVGGVIGMIPEGLVLLTSLSFVLGVGRLAKKHLSSRWNLLKH